MFIRVIGYKIGKKAIFHLSGIIVRHLLGNVIYQCFNLIRASADYFVGYVTIFLSWSISSTE